MLTLKATVDGEPVTVNVVDLTEFVHAEPEEYVCVVSEDGQQTFRQKYTLKDIEVLSND